jgi:hypothetical protein
LVSDWSQWRSCHLYYHGDGNLLLDRLVVPLVGSLLAAGTIDRFFFIRYELGGPHVRLRLRTMANAEGTVENTVEEAARAFFARWPSAQPKADERVRRQTRETMAADPSETDATPYPDNSFRIVPFTPETDRYGGPELIGASLDFFTLSSIRALGFARVSGKEPRSRQVPWILRTLAEQALGFARDERELMGLLNYAAVADNHPLAPFAARGDRSFEEQPDAFRNLLQETFALETGETTSREEARWLTDKIHGAAPPVRERILKSHMHMTANRLGIRNPEEAFLCRILWRAAQDSGQLAPELRAAWRPLPVEALDAEGRLDHLLPAAFATMTEMKTDSFPRR